MQTSRQRARDPELGLERLVAIGDAAEDDELALPLLLVEGLAQQLGGVLLDDDLPLEVGPGAEREVLVGGPGVAVVADDAVGDEVAGAGGDVEHRHVEAELLDRDDA